MHLDQLRRASMIRGSESAWSGRLRSAGNKCVGHPRWRGRSHIRKEPAVPSVSHLGPIHLGLDVHKDTISVAILAPDRDGPDVERIPHDEASVRRLVGRLGDPRWLRACYEAGPTGYELARLLAGMGVRCEVIAPSLIPKAPGDRVKTDRRDCRRLARLHRAGELVAIRIPTVAEEAVRDLCRARADMVQDRTRARHRLSKFLLRHGRPWRGGNAWTLTHERWLLAQHFEQPALAATYGHYRAVLAARDAALEAIEADLAVWYDREPFADAVHRLAAYRGITQLGALTLASEVGDWRRFPRRPPSPASVAWCPRNIPAAARPGGVTSPSVATSTCAPSWSNRPGPTSTGPRSGSTCVGGSKAWILRWWPGPGRPSCGCAGALVAWPPTRTPRTWSSPRSPGNSLGSCGPRWRPDRCTAIGHLVDRRHGDRPPHPAPGHRR